MKRWLALLMAAASVFLLASCTAQNTRPSQAPQGSQSANGSREELQLAAPKYPEMAQYPDETAYLSQSGEYDSEGFEKAYRAWRDGRNARHDQPEGYADGLDGFFSKSVRQLLSDTGGENRVCSPLNVYMALAMLAEVTDGNSRQELLSLLNSDGIEALRTQAKSVWNANYCNDGAVSSVLASSLWLNENVNFVQSTMDSLAENYYASSFRGKMGSDELDEALRAWLNEQTDGLLKDKAAGLSMDPQTIMALATTIYFRAKWGNEFSKDNTKADTFHAASGDLSCDFMHKSGTDSYYWSDGFSAVAQHLEGSGKMWFILPDEGVTPEQLLEDKKTTDFILADGEWDNSKFLTVNFAVPKFDVVSDIDLIPQLEKLGVSDVFDPKASDFTPMTTDTDEIAISQAKHAARVAIDEEGVTAAAYTVMMMAGAGMPPEEKVDFVLDRPFVFAITSEDGLPLFVGIVNKPV